MIKVKYITDGKIEDTEISPVEFLEMLKEDLEGRISISKAIIGDFELNCIELQNNLANLGSFRSLSSLITEANNLEILNFPP